MKSALASPLLKRVDELIALAHPHLLPEDEVYYLGEYTCGQLAGYSDMNRLVQNYKKPMDRQGKPDWGYKGQAIQKAADILRLSLLQTEGMVQRLKQATLVPIPPSAAKGAPLYDDRNLQLLRLLWPQGDIRELILQKHSRTPLHTSQPRDPKKLRDNFCIHSGISLSGINEIWLFDDVLTQGTHFRASSQLLRNHFPDIKIIGLFLARSVYPSQPM